ncbi:helix-turn-helix domain-containing protein [Aquamicrobium lusatiense]|uniref:helix-turn-helix domain-containing protein n=1 Tax=Aquamicrobium lusatiense TaxID=89772 RepID=UPI0024569F70|nr:helix-turn-helix domain-containing protein [Aquamicrobium lusatiense]MDH4990685.1 helix-turn-helix domain-containing protein [Aquamicrobium lusatiense]
MFEQIGTVLAEVLNGCGQVRARVPVRGNSYRRGRCESVFWRKTNWREVQRILLAAKRYERIERRPGKRNGPLGPVAIELLEYLVNVVDFETGRLEPSIDTMAHRLKRSRDAVVRGLANLRRHGFLDWIRRYEPTGNEGRGPQVRQATNAYRLSLSERARQLLGWRGDPPPLPEDVEHAGEVRAAELETYEKSLSLEKWALSAFGDTPLGRAYARLGRNIERESVRRAESRSESIKPAPE